MAAPIKITRLDLGPAGLRREARRASSVAASRRMLALALVLEGVTRTEGWWGWPGSQPPILPLRRLSCPTSRPRYMARPIGDLAPPLQWRRDRSLGVARVTEVASARRTSAAFPF